MRNISLKVITFVSVVLGLCLGTSEPVHAVDIPGNLAVSGPVGYAGGSLKGEYWQRPRISILTGGASDPTQRVDVQIQGFGAASGTFTATLMNYAGNDLTAVASWLGADGSSFSGTAGNLDDGAFRFRGFINVAAAGIINMGTTSDDGARITIGGIDISSGDGSHGDETHDGDANFLAAGLYPIEITYFNGDWTSDGTGANLNHSGNPDPGVHGGADVHLRVGGANVTGTEMALFHATAPSQLSKVVNIGQNKIGTVTDNLSGSFTVVGGGNDIWDQRDEFTYAAKEVTGDFDVQVRVESLSPNARWSKAGLMARESLSEFSRMAFARVTPPDVPTGNGGNGANDTFLSYRSGIDNVAGVNSGQHEDRDGANTLPNPGYPNAWLRLVRSGNTIYASNSADGITWQYVSSQDTATWGGGALAPKLFVGLATSRHSAGPTATAEFRNFQFNYTAPFAVVAANSRGNPTGVQVEFNGPVGNGAYEPLNYTLNNGATVSAAAPGLSANTVQLTTSALTEGTSYQLDVAGVEDSSGNSLTVATTTFVHGAGYEARAIRVTHNKTDDSGYYKISDAVAKGIGDVVQTVDNAAGFPGVDSNTVFEDPIPDTGGNERFGSRMAGVLNITTAGSYLFYHCSDDMGFTYLSTDDQPGNKVQICNEPAWNGRREYVDGGNQASRGSPPANISAPQNLAVGKYYLETIFNEGGGGNNGSAAWQPPGGPAVVKGNDPIPASAFTPSRVFDGFLFFNLGPVTIAKQPANVVVPASQAATFKVAADGTPSYTFQWRRNGVNIPGATGPSYTVASAQLTDDGAQFSVVVANEFSSATSANATLGVVSPLPPHVLGVSIDASFSTLLVQFDNRVEPASAQNTANYTIPGATVQSATVQANGKDVVVKTSAALTPDTAYTLTIKDVKELLGIIVMTPNPTVANFRTGVLLDGTLIKEYYFNISGVNVSDLTSSAKYMNHQPDLVCFTNLFESNDRDVYDNYGTRILGFVKPDQTGNWKFYMSSDDGGALYLSTDENPANRQLIAREPVWNGRRDWTGTARRNAAAPENQSALINLTAGKLYYVEAFEKEGGGGDNLAVAAQFVGPDPANPVEPVPANGDNVMGPSRFAALIDTSNLSVTITSQPASLQVFENASASFTVGATINNFYNCETRVSWLRDGVPVVVDGVTYTNSNNGLTLTLLKATLLDDQSKFTASIQIPVRPAAISAEATLTVVQDNVAPTIASARGSAFFDSITIVYSERVTAQSATDLFGYTITEVGGAALGPPSAITLGADERTVIITLAAGELMKENTQYKVTVNGVEDLAGNAIAPDTMTTFTSFAFSCGFVLFEAYNTGGGNTVSALTSYPDFPNNPDFTAYIGGFDSTLAGGVYANNAREGYGGRISGIFVPPVSGNWILYLRSDDSSELWFNPNGPDKAGAQKVQEETGCCGAFSGHPTAAIPLTAGGHYYIECLYKEGTGGDYGQVAARLESDTISALVPIGANMLGTFAESAGAVINITGQPQSQTFVIVPPTTGGGGPLLDQDFTSSDGGFTVDTTSPFKGTPFTYIPAAGSWQVDQDAAENNAPNTTRLISPTLTVSRAGFVQVAFSHRWSVEAPGDHWDGCAVQVSVNGGAFTKVPGSSFTAGGYNGSVRTDSASLLKGEDAFVEDSANFAGPGYVNSTAAVGYLNPGDTVVVRFIFAADTNTRGTYHPSWEITSVKVTDGNAASTATFSVTATAATASNPNQPIFYSWQRDSGTGFSDVAGANGMALTVAPTLADNGARFRAVLYIPGAVRTTDVATLTVVQPNTPPHFTCGPAQMADYNAGAQTVPNWATDISANSIVRQIFTYANDFSAGAGSLTGTTVSGTTPPAVGAEGALHLTDRVNGQANYWTIPVSASAFETFNASWKTFIEGIGGADGMSFNVGQNIGASFTPEEGGASGLTVAIDTYNNGAADAGLDIKYNGSVLTHLPVPTDGSGGDGSGAPAELALGVFVDTSVDVTASGLVTFTYGSNTITGQIPGYSGLNPNQYVFAARTGGANENCWIDDLNVTGSPYDASSAEAGQTVHFNVSNDNPSLFSVQPAVSPDGTLTYTPAGNRCGTAHVTIVAQDSGGTANGGSDSSAPCVIDILIKNCPGNTPPVAQNSSVSTDKDTPVNFQLVASDPEGDALTYIITTPPAHGTAVVATQTGAGSYTPNAGYTGPDSFAFKVNDGTQDSAIATVSITVRPPTGNHNPTAKIIASPLYDFGLANQVALIGCDDDAACVVLDGSQSSDPDGQTLTYQWFLEPSPVPFATGVLVTNCLEAGEHTIVLSVSDGAGGTGTDTVTVEVIDASEALELLIDKVNDSSIARKNKRPFIATLKAATASLERGQCNTTANQLHAFQNKVRAQVSRSDPDDAATWISWAQHIIDALNR